MRTQVLVVAVLVSIACSKAPPPAASAPVSTATPVAAAPAKAEANAIRGKIAEKIDASAYSYLKLKTDGGEVWTAVPKTTHAVGEEVSVVGYSWMENFSSPTLNRTWDKIAFGALAGETPAPPAGQQQAAQRDPPQGMFASAAAASPSAAPAGHGSTKPPADVGDVKVAKAPGGKTIAEVYAGKTRLKDQTVTVRGKVIKATNGVLGKNWLHLKDGTGSGTSSDLAIASAETADVGATVLVTGVVHLDRDLGAGYHYDVIVEDAKIKTE